MKSFLMIAVLAVAPIYGVEQTAVEKVIAEMLKDSLTYTRCTKMAEREEEYARTCSFCDELIAVMKGYDIYVTRQGSRAILDPECVIKYSVSAILWDYSDSVRLKEVELIKAVAKQIQGLNCRMLEEEKK